MSLSSSVVSDGNKTGEQDEAALADSEANFEILDPKDLLRAATSVGFSQSTVNSSLRNSNQAGSPWGNIDTNRDFLGVDPEKLSRQRCYLIMLVLDDSGSMKGHESSVINAASEFIKEYSEARRSEKIHSDVLVAVGRLNGGLIIPYTDVRNFDADDLSSYEAAGNTPLFDVTNCAISLQIAKTTELALNGITSKTITVLMTDGNDYGSRLDSNNLKTVVKGLDIDGKSNHIVAGIYLGDANRNVFKSIGLKEEWILGSGRDSSKLIDTFSRLSKLSMLALNPADDRADQPITIS